MPQLRAATFELATLIGSRAARGVLTVQVSQDRRTMTVVWADTMDILPHHGPHSGGADQFAPADAEEPADQADGVGCDPQLDATAWPDTALEPVRW